MALLAIADKYDDDCHAVALSNKAMFSTFHELQRWPIGTWPLLRNSAQT